MPVQFIKDASGRLVPQGDAKDTTAYVSEQPPAVSKPEKPKQKNWWEQTLNNLQYEMKRVQQNPIRAAQTYATNASGFAQVNNNVRHEVNQLRNPETRGQRLATYGANAANSIVSQHNPAMTKINTMATQGIATSGANLLRNLGGSSPVLDKAEDRAYQFTGSKPPSEMTPEEKAANDIQASVVAQGALTLTGGAALNATAPKLAALLDPTKAPNLVHAIGRAITAEGLADAVATMFEDNTGGSALALVDALFGTQSDPVKPGMSYPEATAAALLPNAAFAIPLAGLGAAVPRLLPGNTQARRAQRIVDERSRQRNTLESNGVVQSNPETGQSAFTPEAMEQKAPPQTWKEAEAAAKERLGIADPKPDGGIPSQEMTPGGAVTEGKLPTADPNQDPWAVQYDPDLPEADVGLELIERLDDEELKVALDADDPIAAAAELLDSRPELNLDEIGGVEPELARADGGNLANPATPWRSQWQALPTEQLQAMAARSAELGERLVSLTGKTADEAVKADLIDALDSLAADGSVYLPSRMNPDVTLVPTAEIQVDPGRFQFKQGVDAQGQQKGNSLSGVEKWNTDLEQSIQLWLDPADGKPYVVNGHNRVAKAKELGIPSLRAEEILAEDAVQARAAGALANIASGGGTPFDAAKFFRDSGITDPAAIQQLGLPLQSGTTANGLALAQLPDNIFQDAVDGRISLNKAAALGAAGLDEAGMQQAYKLLQGRDMTDGTWSELLQQAKSAPTVDGGQVDLFGNTEQVNLMVQKAELARLLRADISGDKKLFGRTAKNAGKLETAGNKIDAAASGDVAAKAAGLLDAFDREKYLAGSPISEVLNRGAADVAAGAKPSVVAKRLKQELVQALDQVEVPAAAIVEPEAAAPAMDVARELGADERQAMQVAAVQKSVANGKVRPPATPIPEIPPVTTNLEKAVKDLEAGEITDDVVKLLDDEARLQDHYKRVEAAAEAAQTQEIRDAVGYDELSYEQKKALGVTDGFERPAQPVTPAFAFPADLSKSAPRYGMAQVTFGSDLDRAAYMLRDASKKSKGEDRLIAALEAAGLDVDQVRQHGRKVHQALKDKVKAETGSAAAPRSAMKIRLDEVGGGMPADALANVDNPKGWGSVDGATVPKDGYQELPSYYEMNAYQRARYNNMREIGESLTEEIRRVAGADVDVVIDPRLYLAKGKVPGWGLGKPGSTKQIGGWYRPMEDMITINNVLAGDDGRLLQTAYHEAFHRMQYAILTKQELEVMNSIPGRLKIFAGAAAHVQKGTNLLEYQAVAFQKYAFARQLGIDPVVYMTDGTKASTPRALKYLSQVISVFDKLWNVLERAHNWANGRGYQSVKDIYENAFLGKLGQRETDHVMEYITPDQVARERMLEGWRKTLASVDGRVTQLDAEMNQIRALAAKEGC